MLVTICTCTHEWSLISSRALALTLATCHQPLSWRSALTRSISVRSLRLARSGTRIRIDSTACAGVSRASRSASAGVGDSIRSLVSGSRVMALTLALQRGPSSGGLRLGYQLEVHRRPRERKERRQQDVGGEAAQPRAEELGQDRAQDPGDDRA